LLAACVVLSACLIGVEPPPAPVRRSELGLSISTFSLNNGLRVVLVAEPAANDVQVTMRYGVGAADDPAAAAGMAHLVEHLMFDQVLDGETLHDRLHRLTSYFNGETTLDATLFVARAYRSHLEELLAIEAARLTTACDSIGEVEFERERAVVINEVRDRARSANVRAVVDDALFPVDHAYRRRIAGTVDSVAAITREQACAFATAHYAIGNAVLVVSGNLTRGQFDTSLATNLGGVAPHQFEPQPAVPPVTLARKHVQLTAPVEQDTILVAWPIPIDPVRRVQFRALATMAAGLIHGQIDASITTVELGDSRFPILGMLISAPGVAYYGHLVSAANHALDALPHVLADQRIADLDGPAFAQTRRTALYRRYRALEHDLARDAELASDVANQRDPAFDVKQQLDALGALDRNAAIELARTDLSFERAAVIIMRPSNEKPVDIEQTLSSDVEDHEPSHAAVDLDRAHRPAVIPALRGRPALTTRTLANGLRVVLLPLSTVPTVDVRLVFRAGTSDEPTSKRGVAMLAGNGLKWNPRYLKDRLLFEAAGGLEAVDVENDRTTFAVSGLDSQVDYLLSGLRRVAREGSYTEGLVTFLGRLRGAHERHDELAATTDAWRAAIYGPDHPYVRAGLMRLAEPALTESDAEQFRSDHYTPDNATLVITGHFDSAVVDRWIDYLFSDWVGRAIPRAAPPAELHASSLASTAKGAQITVELAFPVTVADRAARLVAAEMLSDAAHEIRLVLGASYTTSARLAEQRLSTVYYLRASIDAASSAAAMKLLADRVSRLRSDPELAARTFLSARDHVLAQLESITDRTAVAADDIEGDIELARPPLSDLAVAAEVRDLTIDRMRASLDDLDLSRAAIVMRGPDDAVERAFDALGRKSVRVSDPVDDTAQKHGAPSSEMPAFQPYRAVPQDLVDPLTSRSSPFHFVYALQAGASLATIEQQTETAKTSTSYAGASIAAELGYHRRGLTRVGIRVALGMLAASAPTLSTMDIAPFVHVPVSGPFWGGAFAGMHGEHDTAFRVGAVLGAELGLDLIAIKRQWLGVFGQYAFVLDRASDYGAITFGLTYGY
jgi:zinc protease